MTSGRIRFLAELGPSSKSAHISGESSQSASEDLTGETSNEESDDESTDELPPPNFHSLPEAIKCLDDIQYVLDCRGYTVQSTETMSLISSHYTALSEPLKALTAVLFVRLSPPLHGAFNPVSIRVEPGLNTFTCA